MIQKNFFLKTPVTVGVALVEIKNILKSVPHKGALLTIYETGFPKLQIRIMVEKIRRMIPEVKIAGISLYTIADNPPELTGVRINLIVAQESDFEVVSIPCDVGDEDEAARIMRDRLKAHPDAKAIELFVCGIGFNITQFMEGAVKGHEDVGIFGTMTSNDLPRTLSLHSTERFSLFRQLGENIGMNQMLIGDAFYDSGFVAVIFYGENLYAKLNYALGWHPIGREMPVTVGDKVRYGESVLTQIDGMRAVDLFKEYFGVVPDQYLISNICEFPLILRRDDTDICLIPFDYGKEGEIYFNVTVHEGEKVRFSFATHDEVLNAVEQSYLSMKSFEPEALFLILCGNRLNFLQEDASIEWDSFGEDNPEYALIHGISELYYLNGRGGVLNSAHLAIGLREGRPFVAGNEAAVTVTHEHEGCVHHHGVVPLAERMSVFLGKITGQLEGMAKEARAANIAKSAFLSNMSHEIRTPINAILGMDEMILRESNEAKIVEYAEDIRSAGNSLLCIVNDVLDFSKIEAGKMDIIPVEYELASVINDLYNVIRERAKSKGLKLELDIDPSVPAILYGDEIRIKQVITNILTNAVKYTEEGSVTLSIKCIAMGKDAIDMIRNARELHGKACLRNPVTLEIAVRDTGIGIKEEDQEKLFTAFTRVEEERNRTIEGTGLGLTITRQLLNLMDSELKLESVYGEGSVFSFVINQGIVRNEPVGEVGERFLRSVASHRKYKESFTAPDARILVVDDTKMNLDVMKNLLKKTLISIDAVESGQEALECVRKNSYDVIFLDHRMPHMDGVECFRRMQELEDNKSKDAPVISLTANAISGAREEYLKLGFADYLTKPIDSGKLEEMLLRYLPEEKVLTGAGREKEDGRISKDRSETVAIRAQENKSRVVLIDDEKLIHDVAANILGGSYEFRSFFSSDEAMPCLKEKGADLILLDIKMPGHDGFEVLDMLKEEAETADIPVIFLTGDDNDETEIRGFKAGAWDFVRKPFVTEVLLQRVKHTIELSRLQKDLTKEVAVQTLRAEHLTREVMLALSQTVDAKDHYTKGHSERVAGYATMLAARMGMSERRQAEIYAMGLLHDVGKIGVPEGILNKQGRLTDEEFAQIRQHTTTGYDILKTITELPELATGARWHHERYDGTGYPDGRAGTDIPLPARIICVADSYDAMTSNRSYSTIRDQEKVRAELVRCSKSQFDEGIARLMIGLMDEDKDYLMNERGYRDSMVAGYVGKLLAGIHGGENGDLQAGGVEPDEDVRDASLPAALVNNKEIDSSAGVRNCGSVEGYLSVLGDFYETIDDKSAEIEGYYDNEDWEDYTIKVHALKSSARIVGLTELSGMAAALEAAGDEGRTDEIRRDTAGLLEKYRSYKRILAVALGKDDVGQLPHAPDDVIKDAYQALSEFAQDMDYELTRMVMDSMKEYSLPPSDKEKFDKLRGCLLKLDWDGIKEILERD